MEENKEKIDDILIKKGICDACEIENQKLYLFEDMYLCLTCYKLTGTENNIKQIKEANNILLKEVKTLTKEKEIQTHKEEWAPYIICFIFLPITLPILLIRWLILSSKRQNLEITKLIQNNEE